jgi:hypothetical protein
MLHQSRIRPVGSRDQRSRSRQRDAELMLPSVLQDNRRLAGTGRPAAHGHPLPDGHRPGAESTSGGIADGHGLRPADQASRAVLVSARCTQVDRVDVVADALIGVRGQPVDRPAGRNAQLIAAELHRLRRDRGCHRGHRRMPDRMPDRMPVNMRGRLVSSRQRGCLDDGLMPDSRPDSPERVPANNNGDGRATH